MQRGAPPPQSALGRGYLGQPNYNNVASGAVGNDHRPNSLLTSLNQNSALANQMFGSQGSTSALGRITPRATGSAMDYLVPTFNPRTYASRMSGMYRGKSPAATMLDRNSLLAPKSALGRMAAGPRNSLALREAINEESADPSATPAPESGLRDIDALDSSAASLPMGMTPIQRREYKMKQELRGCLERGDDYMRARDFHKAKASYERAQTIAPDAAAPYCRLFMASLLMTDYAQAGTYLRLAVRRAKDAGDLRMNPSECTPSVDELRGLARTIGHANMRADTSEAEFVTLAYLSWLLDDTSIMQSELDRAARVGASSPESVRMREMLLSSSTAQSRS